MIMTGFIPAPNLAPKDFGPTAGDIAAVAGTQIAKPIQAREDARRNAEQALHDLEAARPGGTAWKAAAAADTAAVTAGRPAVQIAELLTGEPQRYGTALAAVAVHQQTVKAARQDLDRVALKSAIETKSTEAALEWAKQANQGWSGRADKDKAAQHRRAGQAALSRWHRLEQIAAWLEGRRTQVRDALDYRAELRLPNDRFARGAWLALELVLEPWAKWWRMPDAAEVEWPLHSIELVEKALQASAVHAVAGGTEVDHRPAGSDRTRSGRDQLAHQLGISA